MIAAAALYLVMAASYLMLARGARPIGPPPQELEAAMEIIDGDLQRIDRVEDDVARLDLLNDRVERLDQAVNTICPRPSSPARLAGDDFTAEFEQVHARIEALRADLEGEARSARQDRRRSSRAGGLIKQLSNELIAAPAGRGASAGTAPPVAPRPFRRQPRA